MSKITNTGVFIVEGSAAAADVAGSSQIWTKSETPSALYHTDDAGNDHRLGITQTSATAVSSGTTVEFTGIPSGVKQVTMNMATISTTGTANIQVQLGHGSTTFVTTGYVSSGNDYAGSVASTTGFIIYGASASQSRSGPMNFYLMDSATNTWTLNGSIEYPGLTIYCSGIVSLAAPLSAVRLITTDAFDSTPAAGKVSVQYQ